MGNSGKCDRSYIEKNKIKEWDEETQRFQEKQLIFFCGKQRPSIKIFSILPIQWKQNFHAQKYTDSYG